MTRSFDDGSPLAAFLDSGEPFDLNTMRAAIGQRARPDSTSERPQRPGGGAQAYPSASIKLNSCAAPCEGSASRRSRKKIIDVGDRAM